MSEALKDILIFTSILILAAIVVNTGEYLGLRSLEAVNYFTDIF